MTQLTWNDVLKREDLVGGEIECQEDGIIYRGPLIEIKEDGPLIHFSLLWCAQLDPRTHEWQNWPNDSFFVNKDRAIPQDIGNDRVFFTQPLLHSIYTIFPKHWSKLDPIKVKGLQVTQP